jgi:hypothetical protein
VKNKYEFALQLSLIVTCLVILSFRWSDTPVNAQVPCDGQPRLKVPGNPKSDAWKPNQMYAIVDFYSDSRDQHDQIKAWPLIWNGHTNCSGVTFQEATLATTLTTPMCSHRIIRSGIIRV